MNTQNNKKLRIDTIVVFLSALLFFYFFIYYNISSDIQRHAIGVLKVNLGLAEYPPNFLYYLAVNIISIFSKNLYIIYLASSLILALSVAAKYKVTKIIVKEKLFTNDFTNLDNNSKFLAIIIPICLILFFPVQDYIGSSHQLYYTGKFPSNVWHNSTTIFLFPFALLLFWKQHKELLSERPITKKSFSIITILIILNILIKPSFFFVYAPISSIFLFAKHKMSYELFKNLIPIFIGLFLLYIMYNILFVLQLGSYNNTSGSIIFAKPFEAWTHVAPGWYVPITFIHSFALPILYMTFYGKELIKNKLLLYSLALTILGLLISIFIIEDGPRKFHGNFMWQNIICSYILIMVVVCDLVKKIIKEKLNSAKLKILFGLLFLHTVSGIIYIIKIFVSKSYF